MLAPVDHAYVGCFHEDNMNPDLAGEPSVVITNAEACLAHCSRGGWSYAAIHNQNICTCVDSFLNYGAAPSLHDCGGPKARSVYKVGTIQPKTLPIPVPSPSPTLPHSRGRGIALPEESQMHNPGHSMPTSPTTSNSNNNGNNLQRPSAATQYHATSAAVIGCIVAGAAMIVAAIVFYVVRYRRGSRRVAKHGQSWIQNDFKHMYQRRPSSISSHIFSGFGSSANNRVSKPAFDHTPVHPFDCSESPALLSVTTMHPSSTSCESIHRPSFNSNHSINANMVDPIPPSILFPPASSSPRSLAPTHSPVHSPLPFLSPDSIDEVYPELSDLQSQHPVATPRRRSAMIMEEVLQSEADIDDDAPGSNLDPRSLPPTRRNLHHIHSASHPKFS